MPLSLSANGRSIMKGCALADETLCVCLTCSMAETLLMHRDDYFQRNWREKQEIKGTTLFVLWHQLNESSVFSA